MLYGCTIGDILERSVGSSDGVSSSPAFVTLRAHTLHHPSQVHLGPSHLACSEYHIA